MKQLRQKEATDSRQALVLHELAAAIIAIDVILLLSVYWHWTPETALSPADMHHSVPAPWIFAAVQLLLHYFSPLAAGVLLPVLTVCYLLFFPQIEGRSKLSWTARVLFWLIVVLGLLLTLAGVLWG